MSEALVAPAGIAGPGLEMSILVIAGAAAAASAGMVWDLQRPLTGAPRVLARSMSIMLFAFSVGAVVVGLGK